MKKRLIASAVLLLSAFAVAEQPAEIRLWSGDAPGSEGKDSPEVLTRDEAGVAWRANNIHRPTITPYLPAAGKSTGVAVVIMAGGGHRELNVGPEGYTIGKWLSERGVAAFVLKYRLAREKDSTYKVDVHALADTQRAIRLVRSRAAEWNVDPKRVGVMGFSAGGELAVMASQRADTPATQPAGATETADPIDAIDAKPAFQVLMYPGGTNSIQPTKTSPPAFMAVGFKDGTSEGLAQAYVRFRKAGVPAELHVYASAGHPEGFREKDNTPASRWPQRLMEWLDDRGFLKPVQ
ncbi:MAG TPA: alpha/beta hydrolase [Tepidisphaeraceae bacterium]|jgi:endo-1,4-beta-xylanase